MDAAKAFADSVAGVWRDAGTIPEDKDITFELGENAARYSALWAVVWIAVLSIPPGRTERASVYRLHFVHGVVGPLISIAHLYGRASFDMTMCCTGMYFAVDMLNMVVNDFLLPVRGYQKPMNRFIEYVHHFIVIPSATLCYLMRGTACSFGNPFVPLIINEISTPFLIVYRTNRTSAIAGPLFVLVFFAVRIVLNSSYYVPLLYRNCSRQYVWWPQAFPFFAIQWLFFFQIVQAVVGGAAKKAKKK